MACECQNDLIEVIEVEASIFKKECELYQCFKAEGNYEDEKLYLYPELGLCEVVTVAIHRLQRLDELHYRDYVAHG